MATPTASTHPSPERIFNTLVAFQQSAALKGAIELDIFTAIVEGANVAAPLAEKIGAAERGVRILCDYLTIHGFLTKEGDRYALTPESAIFLNRHSPACLASMSDFLTTPRGKNDFEALTEAVRKGRTPSAAGDNTKPNDELWVKFARSMAPLTAPSAEFIAGLAGVAEGWPAKSWMSQRDMVCMELRSRSGIPTPESWPWTGIACSKWRKRMPGNSGSKSATRRSREARLRPNLALAMISFC